MAIVKSDPYSQVPIFIKLKYGETELAVGTAFFYRHNDKIFLISNWHNFSGRNPETRKPLSAHGGVPNVVACYLCLNEPYVKREWLELPLEVNGNSIWLEHPTLRNQIDIGVLPVELPSKFKAIVINDLPRTEMELRVSLDVFVLGYPLGIINPHGLPIWKRASVASEPNGSTPYYLVDTATRPGMSGSPVILRYRGFYKNDSSSTEIADNDWFGEGDDFVGIYSGRIGASEIEAQLGKVWKQQLIREVIEGSLYKDH